MFASQSQAKRFFIEKILAQAAREAVPLSDDERAMLSFSESDADSVADPQLVLRLERAISEERYESKIAGLLSRSYDLDQAADQRAREVYGEAHAVLAQGDHYLLVMIERALGPAPGDVPERLYAALRGPALFVLLIVPAVVAFTMAASLLLSLRQDDGFVPIALGVLFLTAIGAFLIRLWLRERRRGSVNAGG